MGFGDTGYDVAHLLGGSMLLVSFVMLAQRRLAAVIGALAVQGALLAAAAIWQGHVQGAAQLYLTGLIALAAKAVAIPLVLRRLADGLPPALRGEALPHPGGLMAGGAALVALAILVAVPATTGAGALARVDLAAALAIVLLGALMMVARRSALAQVAGLMTLENGLILAAVGVKGMPLVIEISTAGLVLVVAVIAGVFARQLREGFGSLDPAVLDRHRGENR
ncbi:MAG: hydrogenase-4 component E [Rubritepida sp.]|nr:hydrogenase-4 component E [Rubritepida sp.]MCU0945148.1 hydrogenase-4 component E [Rubritepida sp.]